LIIIEDLKVVPPGTFKLEPADDVEQESGQNDPPGVSKFANPYYVDWVQEIQEVRYYAFGNQDQKGSKQEKG
jgi:hypothetical protein